MTDHKRKFADHGENGDDGKDAKRPVRQRLEFTPGAQCKHPALKDCPMAQMLYDLIPVLPPESIDLVMAYAYTPVEFHSREVLAGTFLADIGAIEADAKRGTPSLTVAYSKQNLDVWAVGSFAYDGPSTAPIEWRLLNLRVNLADGRKMISLGGNQAPMTVTRVEGKWSPYEREWSGAVDNNGWFSYTGEMFDACQEGKGVMKLGNGDWYDGTFKNGCLHGQGAGYIRHHGHITMGTFVHWILDRHTPWVIIDFYDNSCLLRSDDIASRRCVDRRLCTFRLTSDRVPVAVEERDLEAGDRERIALAMKTLQDHVDDYLTSTWHTRYLLDT